jgi:integrase
MAPSGLPRGPVLRLASRAPQPLVAAPPLSGGPSSHLLAGGAPMLRCSAGARNARFPASTTATSWPVRPAAYPPPMLIPRDAPLAELVSAYLEAGDFTSSSRATYRAHGAALDLPVIGYRRLRPVRTRARTRAEVARILGLPASLREKTLWTLAYESAARAGELLGLDVGDLDLANRRAVVTSKGGAREWVTWNTGTAQLLPRLLKGRREGPVFTTRGASRVVVAVVDQAPDGAARLSYRRAEELFKAATGATLHQLRHSALTHLAEDGASAPTLMTKSRHRSIVSLAGYARPSIEALQRFEAEREPIRRR